VIGLRGGTYKLKGQSSHIEEGLVQNKKRLSGLTVSFFLFSKKTIIFTILNHE
jgi:hypothetical protein